jgi:hypothetical protein
VLVLRRTTTPVLLLALVLGAAACTGNDVQSSKTPTVSASATCGPATSNEIVKFKPGAYRYVFNNIVVDLTFTGEHAASLDVKNSSGAEIGAPGIYVITGTDERFDSQVAESAAVADGATSSFQVTFPDQVTLKTVGLIILKFGDSNYGAFAPVPVAAAGACA